MLSVFSVFFVFRLPQFSLHVLFVLHMKWFVWYLYMSACRGMFADFAESFSSSSAQRELFEPLSRYEQICRENVDVLQRLVSRSVPTHSRSADASVPLQPFHLLLWVTKLCQFVDTASVVAVRHWLSRHGISCSHLYDRLRLVGRDKTVDTMFYSVMFCCFFLLQNIIYF